VDISDFCGQNATYFNISNISIAFGGHPGTFRKNPQQQFPTPTPSPLLPLNPCPMWIFPDTRPRLLCKAYISAE